MAQHISIRREIAEERQKLSDARTPQERLAILDAKFGEGKGAAKERAQLMKLMVVSNKKSEPTTTVETAAHIPEEIMAEINAINEGGNKKKIKAKDRRAQSSKQQS